MEIKKIKIAGSKDPAGHYSQAVVAGNMVFVSGMVPVVPETGVKILGTVEEQTIRVLTNIRMAVEAAGSSLEKIVKVTVYVTDISLWDEVNRTYAAFFGDHKPARAIVPVKDLHYGFNIEADAIAVIR